MAKIHVIDGVTYKEVERRAEVGEKVIVVRNCDGDGSRVATAELSGTNGIIKRESDGGRFLAHDEYRVLEPIGATPTDELLEITANLTRRVFELERENKRLRDDVTETLGTITDLLRKRDRRIEEIDRKVFDTSALKTYSLAELNGKKVTLLHGKDGDYEVLTAKDEDGIFYVISEKEACE